MSFWHPLATVRQHPRLAIVAILFVVVAVDASTPAYLIFNELYLVALLPAIALRSRRWIWGIVAAAMILTMLVAMGGSPLRAEAPASITLANQAIVLLVVILAGVAADRHVWALQRRESAERRVAALASELRQTLDLAPTGLARVTRDLRYMSANQAYARLVGRDAAAIAGCSVEEVLGAEALSVVRPYIDRVLRGEAVNFETPLMTPGTGAAWIAVAYRPWRENDGMTSGYLISLTDITARKQVEQTARERSAELETLIETVPATVWIARSSDAAVIHGNRFAHDVLRMPPGQNLSKSAPAGERPMHFRVMDVEGEEFEPDNLPVQVSARTGRSLRNVRVDVLFDDGARIALIGNSEPLRDANGSPAGSVSAFVDISALVEAQRELALENQHKDEFIAMLAHELRNPLAPVRYAAALLKPGAPAGIVEQVRITIDRQTMHLARLLDDLLDVSRISRNVVTLRCDIIDLRRSVQRAADLAAPEIQSHQHHFSLSLPPEAIWVYADAERIVQMVGNMLSNAIKYTEPGGVLSLVMQLDGDGVVLRVHDTGIGFDSEAGTRLFALFSQLHRGSMMSQGGLGIGLSVVRQLARLHGGEVEASSPGPGKGATFTLRLPRTAAPLQADRGQGAEVRDLFRRDQRVLIIEDNVDAADSLAMLLRTEGLTVIVAYTGNDGLSRAEAFLPGVILLDIGLPDMSGHEVARALRQRSWAKDACLVALSGWATEEDRRRSQEAGINLHMAKPVDPQQLLQLIAESPATAASPERIRQ